jgi:hypothetical protein
MTKVKTAAAVTGALALFLAPVAEAQKLNCAPRDVVTAALAEKHGEKPVLRGMVGDVLLEIWLADNSGSFSIILTQATTSMMACLLAAGKSMHYVAPAKPGEKL